MARSARRGVIGWIGVLGALVSLMLVHPERARADDWSIERARRPTRPAGASRPARRRMPKVEEERADRSAVLVERYRRVLDADPGASFALERLLDLYRERDGNLTRLVSELEEAAGASPAYGNLVLLGHVYKAQDRIDEAGRAYARAAELSPGASLPHEELARLALRGDRASDARRHFERALERTSDRGSQESILRELGALAIRARDFDLARSYYERVSRGAGEHLYAKTEFARALEAEGAFERAAAEYERVLRTLGGDARIAAPLLRDQGRAELRGGKIEEALETLGRALRMAPSGTALRREIYDAWVEAHRRADRLDELVQHLANETGGGFERVEQLAALYDELGRDEEALAALGTALRRKPKDIDTRMRRIRILSRSGRLPEVVDEYRALVRMHPREPRFVVELAQFLMETGRREEALRVAEEAERRHPRDPGVHRALSELYARWGDEVRAARAMRTLARLEPNDPAHWVTLGAQELAEGKRDAALATFRRIVATEPDRARAQAQLGSVLADHDLLEEAERAYREAMKLEADVADHARGLASVLERPRSAESPAERRDRDLEAATLWEKVLTLERSDEVARREARQRIVGIWARRRELKERIAGWEREFEAEPPRREAGRFLAEAYLRERPRRLADADRVLDRLITLEPADLESLIALERVRAARGDRAGAIAVLEKLVDADPKRAPQYLTKLSEHALALYRDEDALRFAEASVQRNPHDASAHRRVGDLHRARQDFERAIASYRRAIDVDAQLFAVFFDLGELHVARGEFEEADRLYRRVARAASDEELVARALRASFQIHLGAGTLETLEADLLSLALAHPQRPTYRRLLVTLYESLARPRIARVARGGPEAAIAERELVQLGVRAIKPLLEALADAQPAQRRLAIELLMHVRNAHAAGPLLSFAEREGDLDLRAMALEAAGHVAAPSLLARFLPFVRGSERKLRETAAWALASSGAPSVLPTLRELLEHADPNVRAFAALGLGRVQDASATSAIEKLARDDRSFHTQAAAVWALGRLPHARRTAVLAMVLRTRSGIVARAAAAALGTTGDRAARPALAEALFDSDPALRRTAARALRRLDRLGGAGEDPPKRIGVALVETLERLVAVEDGPGDEGESDLRRLREPVLEATRDALRGPIERVETALAVLGHPDGRPFSLLVGDTNAETKTGLERELEGWRRELAPALAGAVEHPEPHVREGALRLLALADPDRAEPLLVAAIQDRDPAVQRAAIDAVARGKVLFSSAVSPLVDVLRSHGPWSLRMRAADALGRLGDPSAIAPLTGALERDPYAFVRSEAARALGRLGGPDVERVLARCATVDEDGTVRRVALAAFARSREPSAAEGAAEPVD